VRERIRADYTDFAARPCPQYPFHPLAALLGDNVVIRPNMPRYQIAAARSSRDGSHRVRRNLIDLRFPVQYVIRPDMTLRLR
jgi:bifunctional enzyme CysN/CysC